LKPFEYIFWTNVFLYIYLTCFVFYIGKYNANLRTKLGEDLLTYLEYDSKLWLEAGVTGGTNMNWVYNFFMTKTRDIRADCSFLTVSTPTIRPETSITSRWCTVSDIILVVLTSMFQSSCKCTDFSLRPRVHFLVWRWTAKAWDL
jgi:hypothetical protein